MTEDQREIRKCKRDLKRMMRADKFLYYAVWIGLYTNGLCVALVINKLLVELIPIIGSIAGFFNSIFIGYLIFHVSDSLNIKERYRKRKAEGERGLKLIEDYEKKFPESPGKIVNLRREKGDIWQVKTGLASKIVGLLKRGFTIFAGIIKRRVSEK